MSDSRKRLFGLSARAKEHLIRRMSERRVDRALEAAGEDEAPREARRTGEIPDAFCRFDQLPGYRQLQAYRKVADRADIPVPFFKVHEGTARNTTTMDGRAYVNFSSYNYLDLSGHPAVAQAAKDAIDRYGTSVSASRLVSGERPIQRELERALADLHGAEDCVVFVSGHATNVTTIGHLFGARDLIVHDALSHNSILQGALLSGARRMSFPHNDWQALERLLAQHRPHYERTLVVVEGIYSMDGDFPDLPRLVEIKRRHKAFLMVDEAHSMGVLGERGFGIGEHFGVAGGDVDIWMGTLSKTFASCGGYIAGERALVEYLKCSAPGFLYSVGMAPPVAAAARAAVEVLRAEPERVARLRERGRLFLELAREAGLDTGSSAGLSVVPVITASSVAAGLLSHELFERGVNVQPIIYPAVEERAARLRFFMTCAHTEAQIRSTVSILRESMDRVRATLLEAVDAGVLSRLA